MSKSWAWLFLCLSSIACAQSIDIPVRQCVLHAGDNPAWAKPDLDQSGWKPYSEWECSFDQPRLGVRCKADLGAMRGLTDPAIQISAPAAHLPTTPGITIQSEYHPSREVGGDFFQVLPLPNEGSLVVVGYVAGKGMEAGMPFELFCWNHSRSG